jgi:uncharacterized membrane protein YbhN (UPF0104 family)
MVSGRRDPANVSSRRPWRAFLIKALLLVLLLAAISTKVSFAAVGRLLTMVPVGSVVLLVALSGPWYVLRSLKWWLLLRAFSVRMPVRDMLFSLSLGQLAGSVTPLQVGELARAAPMRGSERVSVALLILLDKAFDLAALLILAGAGIAIQRGAAVPAVGTLTMLGEARATRESLRSSKGFLRACGARLTLVRELVWGMGERCRSKKLLVVVAILSLLCYAIVVLQYHFLLRAVAPAYDRHALAMCPLIMLARAVPFTFSGLGVREGVAVVLLSRFGVSGEAALIASLCMFVVNLVPPAMWCLGCPPRRSSVTPRAPDSRPRCDQQR